MDPLEAGLARCRDNRVMTIGRAIQEYSRTATGPPSMRTRTLCARPFRLLSPSPALPDRMKHRKLCELLAEYSVEGYRTEQAGRQQARDGRKGLNRMSDEVAPPQDSKADTAEASSSVRANSWWAQRFSTESDPADQVQLWVRDVLPECPQRSAAEWVIDELTANATSHTRSGSRGGTFTVEIGCLPGVVRVVVGDQGPDPLHHDRTILARPTFREQDESGQHGLRQVEQLARSMGVTGGINGHWVFADIAWPGDKPPKDSGGREDAALIALAAERFPLSAAWWAREDQLWRAVPGFEEPPAALIEAPSPGAVLSELAAQYADRSASPARLPLAAPVPGSRPSFVQRPLQPHAA